MSNGVDELLHHGVLRVVGTRPTPGARPPGRPARALPGGGHVLVADLGAHGAHLAVVDLSQTMRAHGHVDIDVDEGPDAVLAGVGRACARCGRRYPADAPARAVVIGVPGPVDGRHGVRCRPPIMPGWHAYPVAARLRRRFGCPALLENDVNLRALGEARALPADQAPLLFVKVGTGIGGGLITGRAGCTTAPTVRRATSGTSGCAAAPTCRASAATSAASRRWRRRARSPGGSAAGAAAR